MIPFLFTRRGEHTQAHTHIHAHTHIRLIAKISSPIHVSCTRILTCTHMHTYTQMLIISLSQFCLIMHYSWNSIQIYAECVRVVMYIRIHGSVCIYVCVCILYVIFNQSSVCSQFFCALVLFVISWLILLLSLIITCWQGLIALMLLSNAGLD